MRRAAVWGSISFKVGQVAYPQLFTQHLNLLMTSYYQNVLIYDVIFSVTAVLWSKVCVVCYLGLVLDLVGPAERTGLMDRNLACALFTCEGSVLGTSSIAI